MTIGFTSKENGQEVVTYNVPRLHEAPGAPFKSVVCGKSSPGQMIEGQRKKLAIISILHKAAPWLNNFDGCWAAEWLLSKAINQRVTNENRDLKKRRHKHLPPFRLLNYLLFYHVYYHFKFWIRPKRRPPSSGHITGRTCLSTVGTIVAFVARICLREQNSRRWSMKWRLLWKQQWNTDNDFILSSTRNLKGQPRNTSLRACLKFLPKYQFFWGRSWRAPYLIDLYSDVHVATRHSEMLPPFGPAWVHLPGATKNHTRECCDFTLEGLDKPDREIEVGQGKVKIETIRRWYHRMMRWMEAYETGAGTVIAQQQVQAFSSKKFKSHRRAPTQSNSLAPFFATRSSSKPWPVRARAKEDWKKEWAKAKHGHGATNYDDCYQKSITNPYDYITVLRECYCLCHCRWHRDHLRSTTSVRCTSLAWKRRLEEKADCNRQRNLYSRHATRTC